MGEVYRAHDPKLRRHVAIKILPPAFADDGDRLARFEREAQAVAALSHPNILAIHDFGADHGLTYAVMELLDGQPLRDVIAAGPLPRWKVMTCATQIAKALEAAHARGIVHRDLKPENVFVSPAGHVKILDFGLATHRGGIGAASAETETTAGVTHAGAIIGTPGYMSPEQVRGDAADHRSDIFSFGCVLYELLSRQRAFQGGSAIDTMHAILRSEPRELSTLAADVPPPLVRIVERCLEKAPEARFQSASDLVFALDALAVAPAAAPARTRARTIGAAAAALTLVGVAGFMLTRDRSAGTATGETPAAVAAAPRGIAVLPFENLGSNDQEYFAAGVTEEVTLQLAKIRALRVMSRAAVARFTKGAADLPAITRELNVGSVLTGTIRHDRARVRVGVQLLAAPSGETMWSDQYDGELQNIFDIQSTVALRVAQALQAALAPDERARIERLPTRNAEAYELYLKQRLISVAVPKENARAMDMLQRAIALDPQFALAHSVLARRYHFRGSTTGPKDRLHALEIARTAVSLDPQLPRAHFGLATVLNGLGRFDEARLAMHRAIELDPNFWNAIMDLSLIETNAGRLDEAMSWAKRGIPLAPNLALSYYHLAIPLVVLDDAQAEKMLQAAVKRFPLHDDPASGGRGGARLAIMLAFVELRRGQPSAAIERMRAAVAANPDNREAEDVLTELLFHAGSTEAAARVDSALQEGPDARRFAPYTPRTLRAFLFLRAGENDRAHPLMDAALAANRRAIAAGDRSDAPHYENAAIFAMRGDRTSALDALEQAERAGWRDARWWQRDSLLASLTAEPRFKNLIARMERDVQEMHARVDFSDLDRLVIGSSAPPLLNVR
jgi:TolB-like protein/Flp pilus assembly protein TadD